MQQDAHEFLNYLLNTVSETLIEEKNAERDRLMRNGTLRKGTLSTDRGRDEASGTSSKADTTWIHEIFKELLPTKLDASAAKRFRVKTKIFSTYLWILIRMLL